MCLTASLCCCIVITLTSRASVRGFFSPLGVAVSHTLGLAHHEVNAISEPAPLHAPRVALSRSVPVFRPRLGCSLDPRTNSGPIIFPSFIIAPKQPSAPLARPTTVCNAKMHVHLLTRHLDVRGEPYVATLLSRTPSRIIWLPSAHHGHAMVGPALSVPQHGPRAMLFPQPG